MWIGLIAALAIQAKAVGQQTYRGVKVEPEVRCAPYDRDEYPYPQSVEPQIIAGIGKIYGPYSGQCFATSRETDIEHIVPLSEAHDSGLCSVRIPCKVATCSNAKLPPSPGQSCHLFQSKLPPLGAQRRGAARDRLWMTGLGSWWH